MLYPLLVARGEHWDESLRKGKLFLFICQGWESWGEEDCYVPAGWFWSGGDTITEGDLPRKRIWGSL